MVAPVPISKKRDGWEGRGAGRYELLSLRANLPRALAPSPIVEMKNCHGGLKIVQLLELSWWLKSGPHYPDLRLCDQKATGGSNQI